MRDGKVRRLDQRRRHRRLRHPGFLFAILLIVCSRAAALPRLVPLRGLVSDHWRGSSRPGSATTSGTSRCRSSRSSSAGSTLAGDQELLPRESTNGTSDALKGLTSAACSTATSSATRAAGGGGAFPPPSSGSLFTSALLIEVIFRSWPGLLGFEAAISATTRSCWHSTSTARGPLDPDQRPPYAYVDPVSTSPAGDVTRASHPVGRRLTR